jgi:UDP-GlcNAc:undecaprenyl-phosphate GlcNAc-1-phosphate transferase
LSVGRDTEIENLKVMFYIFFFVLALGLSAFLTPLVKRLAFKFNILDYPNSAPRKIHPQPTALIGGSAVFFSFCISMAVYLLAGRADFNIIPLKFFLATAAGGALLIFGGILDDKYNLPPKLTWLFPAAASLLVVLAGIGVGIKFLSNPFGGDREQWVLYI